MNGEMVVHDGSASPSHQQPPNPLLIVHKLLRGRYALAITLGLILAVPAGIGGYFALKPQYTSMAMLRVVTARAKLLYENEINTAVGGIDREIQAHAVRMQDQSFLFLVAARDDISELDLPQGYAGVARLGELLRVSPQRNSDLIHISVDHVDPNVAHTIVKAVVEEYLTYQEQFDSILKTERALGELRVRKSEELDNLLEQRASLVDTWRLQDPKGELEKIQERRSEVEDFLFEEELFLGDLSEFLPDKASSTDAPSEPEVAGGGETEQTEEVQQPRDESARAPLTKDELAERMAEYDESLEALLENRKRQRLYVEDLKLQGMLPEHPELSRAVKKLEKMNFEIDSRIANFDQAIVEDVQTAIGETGGSPRERAIERVEHFFKLQERLDNQFELVSQAAQEFEKVDRNIAEVEAAIANADRRLDQLQAEKQMTVSVGRAEKFSEPTRPVTPAKDRRIPLAAIGFLGGGGLGVMMIVGFGFIRPRLRYIDEVDDSPGAQKLLGSLPDLSDGDPDAAELAALSIHHIRGTLEIAQRKRDRGSVVTLTSASPGDGKTSVALSLATSFAIAGHRTAIVDADMIGQNLSRELGLDGMPGLVEGIGRDRLNGEVHPTHTENLSAVPVGDVDSFAPERLNIDRLNNFFDALRDDYDFVIGDTGPILGSIEANLISSISDDTILVVSRGRNPRLAKAAEDRLKRLDAHMRGVVFNRARKQDFSRSISTASLRTLSQATSSPRDDMRMPPMLKKVSSETVENE